MESTATDPKTGKSVTVVDGVARFYPPVTDAHKFKAVHDDNGLAVYNGGSYHLAVDASAYGFSAYIAILDATAPTAYEFDYELPDGFKLSENGSGGISILNGNSELVGVIFAPWAYDANGTAVHTEFKLGNDVLIQNVSHVGSTYPVVADPSLRASPIPNFYFWLFKTIGRLNQAELNWCNFRESNKRRCHEAYGHAVWAFAGAWGIWFDSGRNDEKDAFRHCYWSARMTIDVNLGRSGAKGFGDRHEDYPGNPQTEKRMDLHNNEQGRILGGNTRYNHVAFTTCQLWALEIGGNLQLAP